MTVIDGNGLILGRLATNIAQRLLKGEQIDLVNSEKIIISGNKKNIVEKFERKRYLRAKGNPYVGPRFHRQPHLLVKNSIRGMLPSTGRGVEALRKLKCFVGIPNEFAKSNARTVPGASKKLDGSFMTMEEVSLALGIEKRVFE